MQIILTAIDDALDAAWRKHCGHLTSVTFHRGSILDVDCGAVVSPANSFGFMDGGVDAVYLEHFGQQIQKNLQHEIKMLWDGELPVGCATSISTGKTRPGSLIAAPTMRVPMPLPKDTINPYLAARAALNLAKRLRIRSIAFPGLGTLTGRVTPERCAFQVAQAIHESTFPESTGDAWRRHQDLVSLIPRSA